MRAIFEKEITIKRRKVKDGEFPQYFAADSIQTKFKLFGIVIYRKTELRVD